jgi:regulator of replication initiation timing
MREETKLPDALQQAYDACGNARDAIRAAHAKRSAHQHHAADQAQRVADLEAERDELRARLDKATADAATAWGRYENANRMQVSLQMEAADLRARLAELERQEPAGWRPIETAPKDGERVLLRWSGYRRPCVGVWCMDFGASKPTPHWSGDSDRLFGLREARKLQPTHWMPIPAAPEAAR